MSLEFDPSGEGSFFAVLLAGGKGTRFWPASRRANPKQFLRLFGDRSLLQRTWDRFARLVAPERILVVTSPVYAERTRQDLPLLAEENLILEPTGRDTAPAAALAARVLLQRDQDALMVVAPTDHFIQDETAFASAQRVAVDAARSGALVTFGILPDRPATIYGYVEVGARPAAGASVPVIRFREKPAAPEAARFLATGRFFWNAGIFTWRAQAFEEELRAANPALAAAIDALPPAVRPEASGYEAFSRAWESLPSTSIDYALMEKAKTVRLVPLDAGWSDVGGWDAVRGFMPVDEASNRSAEDVLYVNARNCSVHRHASGDPRRLYALVGTKGLIVVETDDAVLVCGEGAGEELRELIQRLRETGREDLL